MKKPIIGVTTYQAENQYGYPILALMRAYVEALDHSGCLPVMIPANLEGSIVIELAKNLDGILFSGGGDIAVERFSGDLHPRINGVDKERDASELSLVKALIKEKKPFLGICRGFQVVVVGMGGSLYTHIEDQMPDALKHDYYPDYPRDRLSHEVEVETGTHLADILGEHCLKVNSLHHQGAKVVPAELVASAHAPDGLVEAVEIPGHPFGIAVQWHPEWLMDQPATMKLFKAFKDAAGRQG